MKYIWLGGKRLYYYDTYNSWREAYEVARNYKKKLKNKYFIMKYEHGFFIPENKFRLYMTKVARLR